MFVFSFYSRIHCKSLSTIEGTKMSRPSKTPKLETNDTQKSLSYYLRNKLNEDCLAELFEYLHVLDLMRICDLDTDDDQFFTVLIRERVISKRLIDLWPRFGRVWSLKKTFEKFGPYIKRLKIPMQSNCLNYILRIIFKYSAPNTLTELQFVKLAEIYEQLREPVDPKLFQQAIPYLRNIKNVLIDIDASYNCVMSSFYTIFLNSQNLKSLKIMDQEDKSLWPLKWTDLVTVDTLNLTELCVLNHSVGGIELAKFVKKLPHLEVFRWHSDEICPEIGEALIKYCPKLRTYGDYCKRPSTNPHVYDFLGQFEHLTRAVLTSSSSTSHDIKSTLQILAEKSKLRELTIYQSTAKMAQTPDDGSHFEYFNGFSSLKNITFHFYEDSAYDTIFKDLGQREPFCRNLMTSMHKLEKFTLIGQLSVFNISKMIQFAPQIREINILHQPLHQMPAEVRRIRNFFQQIADQRKSEGIFNTVRIVMSREQAREFKTLKNIEQIIKIVIIDERYLHRLPFSNYLN